MNLSSYNEDLITMQQQGKATPDGGRGYHDGGRSKSSQFEIPCSPVADGSFDPNVFRWLLPSSLDGEDDVVERNLRTNDEDFPEVFKSPTDKENRNDDTGRILLRSNQSSKIKDTSQVAQPNPSTEPSPDPLCVKMSTEHGGEKKKKKRQDQQIYQVRRSEPRLPSTRSQSENRSKGGDEKKQKRVSVKNGKKAEQTEIGNEVVKKQEKCADKVLVGLEQGAKRKGEKLAKENRETTKGVDDCNNNRVEQGKEVKKERVQKELKKEKVQKELKKEKKKVKKKKKKKKVKKKKKKKKKKK